MGQLGFFDADRRLCALSERGDPLEAIAALVPWESFRADIEAAVLTPEDAKKSRAGRKPFDALVMLRMLVLQSLYNLSDEQIEFQVWDRATFTRFVGLGSEDSIPDGTTLWLFREKLARAGLIDRLFDRFDQHLNAKGFVARGGQMVDACGGFEEAAELVKILGAINWHRKILSCQHRAYPVIKSRCALIEVKK